MLFNEFSVCVNLLSAVQMASMPYHYSDLCGCRRIITPICVDDVWRTKRKKKKPVVKKKKRGAVVDVVVVVVVVISCVFPTTLRALHILFWFGSA